MKVMNCKMYEEGWNDAIYGELLDLKGNVRWNGQAYVTLSTAAKVIATDWKQVNGWMFWKYEDPESREWEYIGKLRGE